MRTIKFIAATGFILSWLGGFSQNLSNRGKEFWVGYGHHQFMEPGQSNSQEMVLYFSAEQAANVTVTINGTAWVRNYSIPANSVIASEYIPKGGANDCRLYSLPPSFGGTGGEGLFNRGIHIVSDVPIVAYAHIFGSASSGATMLMPVETWGYSYASINSQQNYGSNNCFSWLYVVAKEDNTVIEITPSVLTRNNRPASAPFTATLNKGQIYQVIGASLTSSSGRELTGTRVKSIANANGDCFPIAVFAGSSRTAITCPTGGGGSGDNIMQQIFPFQAWGKRYLTAPFSHANSPSQFNGSVVRVAIKEPGTVVKRNGTTLTALNGNFYYEFQSTTADFIEADKPIMVAQYMPSSGQCGYSGTGDPEMIYLSPIEQAIKRIGFFRNNEERIGTNYLTMIIPTGGTALSSLRIDGQAISSIPSGSIHTYPHPNLSGYTIVVRKWTTPLPPTPPPGQCIVESDSAFTAITYGLGSVESYGYNAGTLINNLSAISSIHNSLDPTRPEHEFTCTNTTVELSALMAYQPTKLIWRLSTITSGLSPNTDYTDNAPVAVETVVVNGITYYKYRLPGTYEFSIAGTYEIPIVSTHPSIENCNNTEELKIYVDVKPKPKASFQITHATGCSLDTVYLNAAASTAEGYELASWDWSFPGGATATGQDTIHLFAPGINQDVSLSVVTSDGCVADTTMPISVYAPPVVSISGSGSLCEDASISLTPAATYDGSSAINNYYWDFGNGNVSNSTTPTAQSILYPDYGSYTVKLVAALSATCISDTLEKVVTVYSKPVVSISFPLGCLPENGEVLFDNTTATPDGQSISSHNWNFGDANATASNPNTSIAKSPSHIYTEFGAYDIYYSATSSQGCVKDTTIETTFNLAPKLLYPALAAVCQDVTGISVATASVTNGVPGSGIYSGPGVSADGSFDPAVAGAGIHTVTYNYTTTTGCTAAINNTIEVYPKPVASFTSIDDVCLNEAFTFTSSSTIASGAIQTWGWNLGNGDVQTNNNAAPVTITYSTDGDYLVKHAVTSDRGCKSDTFSKLVTVHPLPTASFTVPVKICLPGPALFQNTSSVSDNSALSYQWNFGDAVPGTSTSENPSYTYASAGNYNVSLTATSSYGCQHVVTQTVNDFYNKPVADFEVTPSELCQGANTVFIDASFADNSTITEWKWDFGDGTPIETAQQPNKQFANPGTFPVSLIVTNAAGCTSDPFIKTVTVHLQPVIDAGRSFIVPEGTQVQFQATANSPSLSFSWTPSFGLSDPTSLTPSLVALSDQQYILTATGDFGCTSVDSMSVRIFRQVKVPNVFSPNGDGIHDLWLLPNLTDYPGCTVEVFNRYGQRVFISKGYSDPWNGKLKGNDLPVGAYYYVIRLENGFKPITGSVTILR